VITLRLDGGPALAAALRASPALVRAAEQQAMTRALLLVEADARRRVAHDTRQLMNSLTSAQRVMTAGAGQVLLGAVAPSARYGRYVEQGTRPHWPPRAPLEGWARRHGIPVCAVQRAIARRGTRARPFLGPALRDHAARIGRLFAAGLEAVMGTIARQTGAPTVTQAGPGPSVGGPA
jgi:hypothetical protein